RTALGLAPDARVACVIARLNEQKGHRFLLEALATTPALADLQLIVVGDGPLRGALEQDARDRGLAARVHFVGARRDLGDLLWAADLLGRPSWGEGRPLSLVRARGAGVRVVSTAVAGAPEVVEDGRTGFLGAPADARALGEAMARVVADPEGSGRMAADARAHVLPRFDVDGYVTAVVALYERLLAERARAA